MPLTHAIAHQLVSNSAHAALALREREFELDSDLLALHAQLKGAFLARLSREHGSFESNEAPLPTQLTAFLQGQQAFGDLSQELAKGLQQHLNGTAVALDAHLYFFIEESLDHHLFTLFVARQNELLGLSPELELTPCKILDTGPTLFGIKVDLREWQEHGHYAYLSLLPPRGSSALSEAFYQLCGFHNGIDKQAATLAFLEGVEAYAREVPVEQQRHYRDQVVSYCMEQEGQGEAVELQALALALDGEGVNPEDFLRTVSRHTAQLDEETATTPPLVMDRRSLRRYIKFAGREKDLAISFSSYQLDERVRYDADSDTLHISGLPKALKRQLLNHINGEE